jgi:hypothetical protein
MGDRRVQNVAAIKQTLNDRRQAFGEAMAMIREELATLNGIKRLIALKHFLLNNMAEATRPSKEDSDKKGNRPLASNSNLAAFQLESRPQG